LRDVLASLRAATSAQHARLDQADLLTRVPAYADAGTR